LGASNRYDIIIELLELYIPKPKVIEVIEKPEFDPRDFKKAEAKIKSIDQLGMMTIEFS
jgi:hypothetical protein